MREIKVQKLDQKKFAKYGEFQNLLDDAALAEKSLFPYGFFADVVKLDFAATTLPTISVCQVKKQEKNIISLLEAHKFTCEGLLPLDDDVIIFTGTPLPGKKFSVETVEAFYVPKGTFVKLNPLVLHGTQFPVSEGTAHVVCMLPGRTFMNDMLAEPLPEEERAIIVME
ncbi:MAG: hypothetical protein Q4C58_15235 [Eubacteriales bacterium]|nr:hypothetical protein [Eubacteriales bacterium]